MGLPAKKDILKKEIDTLSEDLLGEVIDFVGYLKMKKGIYENDTDYLESIPMVKESILDGEKEKIEDCKPLKDIKW